MATVTTVTPSTTVRSHAPGIPDEGGANLAGEIDLATVEGWTFISSFVASGLGLTYNSSGPSVDIAQGRVARTGTGGQELITVGAVSGVSLSGGTTNYIYYRADDVYEVRDQDTPPSPNALLVGTINTSDGTVTEAVRGRSPISQFASVQSTVSGSDGGTSGGSSDGGAGGYLPTGATLQSRTDTGTLGASASATLAAPEVDVTNSDYVYVKNVTDDTYIALDVSDPANPSVNDTISSPITVDRDNQLVAHPDGSWLYDEGPNVAIELSSAGTFSSATDTSVFGDSGAAALGDSLYTTGFDAAILRYDISTRDGPSLTDDTGLAPNNDDQFSWLTIDDNDILYAHNEAGPEYVAFDVSGGQQPVVAGFGNPPQSVELNIAEQWAYDDSQERLYVTDTFNNDLIIADLSTATGGAAHSISDSGTEVLASPTDVNFGSGLSVTDDGDDTATVSASGGGDSQFLRAYLSAAQTIPASSSAKIAFDQEGYDSGQNHSSGEYAAPSDGKYEVKARLEVQNFTDGQRVIANVRKDSTDFLTQEQVLDSSDPSVPTTVRVDDEIELGSGQILDVELINFGASSIDVASGEGLSHLIVKRTGDL